jgi:ABC-type branched-subunit amino acid transport system ATPase component
MTGGILEIDAMHAGYDGAPVVRNLTLSVAPGEIVALLGANGAGKTTTLRTVSGIVRPLRGDIRIAGTDTSTVSASQIAPSTSASGRAARSSIPRRATGTSRRSPSSRTARPGCCPAASSRCWRWPVH